MHVSNWLYSLGLMALLVMKLRVFIYGGLGPGCDANAFRLLFEIPWQIAPDSGEH